MAESFSKTRKTQVDKHGRIVIPIEVREELGLQPGEQVVLRIEDGTLRLENLRRAIRRSRGIARAGLGDLGGRSLVDEFIAQRRAEAERE
jgi:AbrB family looped-hinge helix DNA binding protein